jgi:hypothetical protein
MVEARISKLNPEMRKPNLPPLFMETISVDKIIMMPFAITPTAVRQMNLLYNFGNPSLHFFFAGLGFVPGGSPV